MSSQFKKVLDQMSARHHTVHVMAPAQMQLSDRIGRAEKTMPPAMPPSARQPSAAQVYLAVTGLGVKSEAPEADYTFSIDDLKKRIRAGLTRRQVSLLRRRFAQYNHPDRTDPSKRDQATALMAQANDLLDDVLGKTEETR